MLVGRAARHVDRLAALRAMPLFGVPFAVKDNIDVAGVPTTAACPAFAYAPGSDAHVVRAAARGRRASASARPTSTSSPAASSAPARPTAAVPNAFDRALRHRAARAPARRAWSRPARSTSRSAPTRPARAACRPGFNNIVGLKPTRGPGQHPRRRAGLPQRSTACRSSRCTRRRRRARCCGRDRASIRPMPYSRASRSAAAAVARRACASACRRSREFFGDAAAAAAFGHARSARLRALGRRRRCRSTTRRCAQAAALLYDSAAGWPSAMPRSRASSTRTRPMSIEPVRSIIDGAAGTTAPPTPCRGQYALRALRSSAQRACGTTSTCCWCRPPRRTTRSRRSRPTRSRSTAAWAPTPTSSTCSTTRALAVPSATARPTACPSASR